MLWQHGRYHGADMHALATRTLSSCGHACSGKITADATFSTAKSRKHRKYRCIRCLHARAATTPRKTRQARHFQLKCPPNTENTDVVGMCAARVNSTVVPLTNFNNLLREFQLCCVMRGDQNDVWMIEVARLLFLFTRKLGHHPQKVGCWRQGSRGSKLGNRKPMRSWPQILYTTAHSTFTYLHVSGTGRMKPGWFYHACVAISKACAA